MDTKLLKTVSGQQAIVDMVAEQLEFDKDFDPTQSDNVDKLIICCKHIQPLFSVSTDYCHGHEPAIAYRRHAFEMFVCYNELYCNFVLVASKFNSIFNLLLHQSRTKNEGSGNA